jgi:non-specific serine/threonine protein kinase
VLGLLARLVDTSLVLAEEVDGQARFRLLEPIRQYAQERLRQGGDEEGTRRQHAAYYLALAEELALLGGRGERRERRWMALTERHYGNLLAALAWSQTQADGVELGLRLAASLSDFWFNRGYSGEGQRWLAGALARAKAAPPAVRARALGTAAILAYAEGAYERAAAQAEEVASLYRGLGDTRAQAYWLHALSVMVGYRGDFAASRCWADESLALFEGLGDAYGIGLVLYGRGKVARYQGEPAAARALLEQGLPALREARDRTRTPEALVELAGLAQERGDGTGAAALVAEGLHLLQEIGRRWWYLPECLEVLAAVAAARGGATLAARLFGAAEAVRAATGTRRPPGHDAAYVRHLAVARATLVEATFGAAWSAGRALGLEEALAEALAEAERAAAAPAPHGRETAGAAGPLTRREQQVAALIADGLTDRQIAERLVLSRGTVGQHVVHILDKLGFRSRAQVAAWAAERGLAGARPG